MNTAPLAIGQRLLIYGGTFDPPHRAHVELPFIVKRKLDFDGVIFVPAGRPPHKPDVDRTPGRHRLAMLKAALGDRPDASICPWELDRDGPSYTWHTVRQLADHFGSDVTLRLLIGADMALIFDQWVKPEVIERIAEPVVMIRPPYNRRTLLKTLPADRWADRLVDVPPMEEASSDLRQVLVDRGPDDPQVRDALPSPVLEYIRRHGLYAA